MSKKRGARSSAVSLHSELRKLARHLTRLRGHVGISEFKQLVFGLILLKHHASHETQDPDANSGMPIAPNWHSLSHASPDSDFTALFVAYLRTRLIEIPALQDLLPRDLLRNGIEASNLRELILSIDHVHECGVPLPDIFDHCLKTFAHAERGTACEYFTPSFLTELMVRTAAPAAGIAYDPCCGTGGLLIEVKRHLEREHPGAEFALHGQESRPHVWNLCKIRAKLYGAEINLGMKAADSFKLDLHAHCKADLVLANTPFNTPHWGDSEGLSRKVWKFGMPPEGNANFAWLQHALDHLAPNGTAVMLLSNASLSSTGRGEAAIRQGIVSADLVDCIVALPKYQVNVTRVYACLWILSRDKSGAIYQGEIRRDRRGQVLMIDAQNYDESQCEDLNEAGISRIVDAYHSWRNGGDVPYADEPGFCNSVSIMNLESQNFVLTPGRYVKGRADSLNRETSNQQLKRAAAELNEQFRESARLEREIKLRLTEIGFDV